MTRSAIVASPLAFLTGKHADPDQAVRGFLNQHAGLFGHNADALAKINSKSVED